MLQTFLQTIKIKTIKVKNRPYNSNQKKNKKFTSTRTKITKVKEQIRKPNSSFYKNYKIKNKKIKKTVNNE